MSGAATAPGAALTVDEARARILALMAPTPTETVALEAAGGRVLAEPVVAARPQPPFAASAMDGYAVRAAECRPGATLDLVGAVAAGSAHPGALGPGDAVRIFTGAPMPEGSDAVLIQEDAETEGAHLRPLEAVAPGAYVRPRGLDFAAGARIDAPRRLTPFEVALAAAMGAGRLTVRRPPVVAILPTGDELATPGETVGPNQIYASNNYGLAALLAEHGAAPRLSPPAADTPEALAAALREAADGADLIVTLGGASVGAHDHVRGVIGEAALDFWRIAMRPGKPLMAGRFGAKPMIGLPGNPVSALICGLIFVAPAIDALLGLKGDPPKPITARLAHALPANGPREHYMRAVLSDDRAHVRVFDDQDSSRLALLAEANALAIRPIRAVAANAGDPISVLALHA